jgi:hypothetical protein
MVQFGIKLGASSHPASGSAADRPDVRQRGSRLSVFTQGRSLQIASWFLAISYGLGAPVTAIAELRSGALSERFGLPPELIYLTCAVQLASAPSVLLRVLSPWAALGLTVVTVGAIGVHLNTESPIRAIPAVLYTGLQIWFGIRSRNARSDSPDA